ncbi:PWWP domain-containing DNA repair factor 3B-like [Heterodontus francisci]|uniref:PWWP domain-containing DNA repair factor 3B-like n=1 Tax=Heterodontus francisci TaxID=7792 RepID=UPI00355C82B8
MTDLEQYIFCKWQGRLWPAKILLESGISPSKTSKTDSDCLDVQLMCLDKQLTVKCKDTRPFELKQAESISSDLGNKRTYELGVGHLALSTCSAIQKLQHERDDVIETLTAQNQSFPA